MIDFSENHSLNSSGYGDAGREMLHARSLSISADLSDIKNNKFNLGCHLIDLYESHLYACWADGYVM